LRVDVIGPESTTADPIDEFELPVADHDVSFCSFASSSALSLRESLDSFVTVPMAPLGESSSVATVGIVPATFKLRIRCSDSGIGIPAAALETLFDPWTQAARTTAAEYGGSGLGLSISSQILSLMGGSIKAESEVGKGTTFEFWVPLTASGKPKADSSDQSEVPGPSLRSSSHTSGPTRVTKRDVAEFEELFSTDSMLAPLNDLDGLFPSSSEGTLVGISEAPTAPPPVSRTRRILVTDDSSINRKILCRILSISLPKLFPRDTWIVEEAGDGTEAVDAVARDLVEREDGTGMIELTFMDVVSCNLSSSPVPHANLLLFSSR
jgi:osomolarity two-component system sensor histidine kinase SLN1